MHAKFDVDYCVMRAHLQAAMVETARIVSAEGAALVERQTSALLGDIKKLTVQLQVRVLSFCFVSPCTVVSVARRHTGRNHSHNHRSLQQQRSVGIRLSTLNQQEHRDLSFLLQQMRRRQAELGCGTVPLSSQLSYRFADLEVRLHHEQCKHTVSY